MAFRKANAQISFLPSLDSFKDDVIWNDPDSLNGTIAVDYFYNDIVGQSK